MSVILSYVQTQPVLEARKRGQVVVETSPDLGISNTSVTLNTEGVIFATGERLNWASVEKISQSKVNCYTVVAQGAAQERGLAPFSDVEAVAEFLRKVGIMVI